MSIHEDSGHDKFMAPLLLSGPRHIAEHLHDPADREGHEMSLKQIGEFGNSVSRGQLAEFRWRNPTQVSGSATVDRWLVAHEQLHELACGPQAVWERRVRVGLFVRGIDPDKADEQLDEGFSQEWNNPEYHDDPDGYVDRVIEALDLNGLIEQTSL